MLSHSGMKGPAQCLSGASMSSFLRRLMRPGNHLPVAKTWKLIGECGVIQELQNLI